MARATWRGIARCDAVRAGGQERRNGVWCFPHPGPIARAIKDHVAFWNGIRVELAAGSRDQSRAAG